MTSDWFGAYTLQAAKRVTGSNQDSIFWKFLRAQHFELAFPKSLKLKS